ncbi:odorant receptor 13a-like [Achroia grisella]|uniref:odorant receptor 13a-like n=1 Tax=Achroia grisella TaxID=688607 RepID=UPI0027D2B8A6|nr:odorant receptor 13a-like [Achroia grisella]
MTVFDYLWRKISQTKAIEKSSGELETAFFESVYRVTYLVGFSTSDDDWPYLIYSSIVKISVCLVVLSEFWYMFTLTTTLDELAGSINITVIHCMTCYRFVNMAVYKDVYKKLAQAMESPYFDISTFKRKKITKFWAQQNEKYLKTLLIIGNSTLAAWFINPLIDGVEHNVIGSIYVPFSYDTTYRYTIAYLMVIVPFTYASYYVMLNDLIMQAHLIHLVCQFNVLVDCFKNIIYDCQGSDVFEYNNNLLITDKFKETYVKRLRDLVEQHRSLLSLAMKLRHTLSGPMLAQLVASGILICFVGYQATTIASASLIQGLTSILYLGYNLFAFYIICRWSEEITTQSQNIGEAVYCSGWEQGASIIPTVRSSLLLIIGRANIPLIFSAGGMYNLSLQSYTSLVKTSYSALTVLLRFRQN